MQSAGIPDADEGGVSFRKRWYLVAARAVAGGVGGDLGAVSAEAHAAPSARPDLACVVKVKDTVFAFAYTPGV